MKVPKISKNGPNKVDDPGLKRKRCSELQLYSARTGVQRIKGRKNYSLRYSCNYASVLRNQAIPNLQKVSKEANSARFSSFNFQHD